MAMSHANCTHSRTPAGRRACRAAGLNATAHIALEPKGLTMAEAIQHVIDNPAQAAAAGNAKTEAWIMSSGTRAARSRVVRRMRQGDAKKCVQAALHIDEHGGRCACGWEAAKVPA
jgi:hypothetical protein